MLSALVLPLQGHAGEGLRAGAAPEDGLPLNGGGGGGGGGGGDGDCAAAGGQGVSDGVPVSVRGRGVILALALSGRRGRKRLWQTQQ